MKVTRWMRMSAALGFSILLTMLAACGPKVEPADLVLTGGKVVTVSESHGEVQALAVRGDRIVAVGSAEEIDAYVGPDTEVVNLDGRLAIPGFIEGHAHFLGVGEARMNLDLMAVRSWDEVIAMVAEAVAEAEPGEWITGRGWHQEKWDSVPEANVDGLPIHDALSAVSPDNPVVLRHASGHSSFANAKAMELGGVTAETTPPPGGEIVRDADGQPIGHFRETAMGLVSRQGPPDEAARRRMVELATEECLSKGVTSFQDAGSSFAEVDLLRQVANEGSLGLRLWVMIRDNPALLESKLPQYKITDLAGKRLTVGGIKHSIDGALGSHGAWLLEPYSDMPGSSGLNTVPPEVIERSAELAMEHGFQLCVHAIGDRANRETLDIFERAFTAHPENGDPRWRIEHAQHLNPADIPRFAELGVIASMQSVHCTSDGPWVPERLGEERSANGAYLWRTLIDSGVVVSNGTDAPVEDVDPIANYHSAVTRRMGNGEDFYPAERMTRMEALESYTKSAAFAAFQEEDKGTLEPGKLADIVILSKDILTVPEEEILEARVDHTILGGEVVYSRQP